MRRPLLPAGVASHCQTIRLACAYVYFLLDGDEVVYVGSALSNVHVRIDAHRSGSRGRVPPKSFDRVALLPVPAEHALSTELRYIRLLRPRHNRLGAKPIRRPFIASGEAVRIARERRGLRRGEVARVAGRKGSTLEFWEAGIKRPPADVVNAIAGELGLSAGELLAADEDWRTAEV